MGGKWEGSPVGNLSAACNRLFQNKNLIKTNIDLLLEFCHEADQVVHLLTPHAHSLFDPHRW